METENKIVFRRVVAGINYLQKIQIMKQVLTDGKFEVIDTEDEFKQVAELFGGHEAVVNGHKGYIFNK